MFPLILTVLNRDYNAEYYSPFYGLLVYGKISKVRRLWLRGSFSFLLVRVGFGV